MKIRGGKLGNLLDPPQRKGESVNPILAPSGSSEEGDGPHEWPGHSTHGILNTAELGITERPRLLHFPNRIPNFQERDRF